MESLPKPDERIFEELDEVFGLPERASYKHLAQLRYSWELCNEVWARFERGSESGRFPILSEFLSNFSSEEKETFFRTGGMQALFPLEECEEKPWDGDPYQGDLEWYRDDLYDGVGISGNPDDLPGLAVEWLEELAREGYRGKVFAFDHDDRTWRFPARQKTTSMAVPESLRVSQKAQPVHFNGGAEVLWLELHAGRSERGHREIKLNDEPLRTDTAILAALITMECRRVDLEQLRMLLSSLPANTEETFRMQACRAPRAAFPSPRTLDVVTMLLHYHKPDFEGLNDAERRELLERGCSHINDFLIALRRVIAFLDYGVPGRQLRSAKGEAEKHIEASVLKHVYELSTTQVAREMGEPIGRKQKDKNDPATVRQWVRLGTQLMEGAMGEERWWAHVEAMKAETQRWNNLTEEEQQAEKFLEDYAEAMRISLKFAREDVDENYTPPELTCLQTIRLNEAREAKRRLEENRDRATET